MGRSATIGVAVVFVILSAAIYLVWKSADSTPEPEANRPDRDVATRWERDPIPEPEAPIANVEERGEPPLTPHPDKGKPLPQERVPAEGGPSVAARGAPLPLERAQETETTAGDTAKLLGAGGAAFGAAGSAHESGSPRGGKGPEPGEDVAEETRG